MKPFLTAKWTNLIIISYAVSDASLTPYLPPNTELDRWEGKAYVSVVAFDFTHTKIRGVGIPNLPNLRDFPELNLRFYARQGDRHGVVFIKEIVGSPLVASLARLWYNEPYTTAKLKHTVTVNPGQGRVERHTLTWRGMEQIVGVAVGKNEPETPPEGGFSRWITEQPWGFGKTRMGRPTCYRVAHPEWRTSAITGYENTLDFAAIYGEEWQFLKDRAPESVIFAEGSPIVLFTNQPVGPQSARAGGAR